MWTTENRGRYDRSLLRYPSDLTDEEWAFIEPLIPPVKRGGDKRTVNLREVLYVLSTGCQWRRSPRICRRARLSMVVSICGIGTERLIESITNSMSNVVNSLAARPAPQLRSSTLKASKAQKNGGL